jgi:hypothetical protein
VPQGAGAALSWRVVVEGQVNAMPLASYAPPSLTHAHFLQPGVTHADTQGGTVLAMAGRRLWNDVTFVVVSVTTPAGSSVLQDCSFTVLHEALACTLPPGSGSISVVSVTVLGQTSTLAPVGLSYAPPIVNTVLPAAWPTNTNGAALTVTGRGFGPPSQSSLVTVVVWGVLCGSGGPSATEDVTLRVQTITVRSDTELALEVQGTAGHVVSLWFVSISVAGQAVAGGAWSLPTRKPTTPTLSFARGFNGTHYFVLMTGSEYGPVAGTGACTGDINVTIDGSPCDALSMLQVCGALVVVVRGTESQREWAPLLCLSCACFPCCKHLTLRATGCCIEHIALTVPTYLHSLVTSYSHTSSCCASRDWHEAQCGWPLLLVQQHLLSMTASSCCSHPS